MCGPSSALKAVNTQIQNFASTVKDEAGTVFGDANTVFNKITGALSNIISGGPGQNGWSATENNARTAATVQAGAAEARNLKGAAASGAAAIGGGNTVNPSGSTQATVMGAEEKAAADTAAGLNANQIANAEAGRAEFNSAVQQEEAAPGVFNASTAANQEVGSAEKDAFQSQQEMDNQSNWAMNDIMKLGTTAVNAAVGGLAGGGFAKMFSGGGGGGNTGIDPNTTGVNGIGMGVESGS